MRILEVPKQFMPEMTVVYPPHQKNKPMIEERFYNYILENNISSKFIYIPIFWTQYFINQGYAKYINEIKNFIDNLNSKYKSDKFFTIVQYDGGTLVPINNSYIFACSGSFSSEIGVNSKYIPIPLLCEKHNVHKTKKKKFLASFVGSLETHPIRKRIYDLYYNNESFLFKYDLKYFKSLRFKSITNNSKFCLCPRGYGPASFRFYEAIDIGSIPVYISDQHWLPFKNKIDWNRASVLIKNKQINNLEKKLNNLCNSELYHQMNGYIGEINKKYLNWDGTINTILEQIC